jgi:hypothetical protein
METLQGIKGTTCEGIFFVECPIPGAQTLRHVSVEISRQNSNLGEVKRRIALDAKNLGATAVMNFKYGQRAHAWWELVFTLKWDTESWWGEGDAVQVSR